MYIWQNKLFPNFSFDSTKIASLIQDFTLQLGEANGLLLSLSQELKQAIFTEIMLSEALKTSEIEGEYFSREDVMSSLKFNLEIKDYHVKTKNRKANAIAQLMIEVQKSYSKPLTEQLLLDWHAILMAGEKGIAAGSFRTGAEPMQVVSGKFGDFEVHYEAPPSKDLPEMIAQFLSWYQDFSEQSLGKVGEAMIVSAISHLYFETLHPFEDGNGRIGRALAEKSLAEKLEIPVFISLSKAIEKNKKQYYDELKKAQRKAEITDWIQYFSDILNNALADSKQVVLFTLQKVNFFDRYKNDLNERELKAINKMLEYGIEGFKGGMTAKKYISINKTSKATATRDLQHLSDIGVFNKMGGGRSISYTLILNKAK